MEAKVTSTPLAGLFVVEGRCFRDGRGFFSETWHRAEFAELGIGGDFVQDNLSRSTHRVLRGLHYQGNPSPAGKLVRTSRGAVFDVAVDIRHGSPTYGKWHGVELSEENGRQLWVPAGFAHGFQVLSDLADVQYKVTAYYAPDAEGAIAWDDPEIGVEWPLPDPVISKRDTAAPSFREYTASPAFRHGGIG